MSKKTYSNQLIDFKRVIEMGQLFLYEKLSDFEYLVYSGSHVCRILIDETDSTLVSSNLNFWEHYFDLDSDYDKINRELREHCKAHNDEYGLSCIDECQGLRLCNQPYFETSIEFLLSAQNTVDNIRKAMFKIKNLGQKICFDEDVNLEYKAFPSQDFLKTLSEADFKACGAGFRSRYLLDFAKNATVPTGNYEHIMSKLQKYKGIGPKVAGCIALYGLRQTDAFPVDVWIQRVLDRHYPNNSFVKPVKNAGILQLYMYEKIRRDGKTSG